MKNIKSWATVLIPVIIILWFAFGIVPFFVTDISESTIRILNVSYASATALFTGIAFVVTYHFLSQQQESIKEQQENLKLQQESLDEQQKVLVKQTNLGVFSESMRLLMDNRKFTNCQEYIYSNNFLDDIRKVRAIVKVDEDNLVSLNDFRNACKIISSSTKNDKDEKKELSDSYDKIKYFCKRMEFLGLVVSKEEAAKDLILSYYGPTIIDTYKRLKTLIEETRKNRDYGNLYGYYTELYNTAMLKRKE